MHVYKIFFSYHRLDHIAKVFGYRITVALADNLARILNCKLDFQVFIPIGIDLEPAFADPLGIVFIDTFYSKIMSNVEFFQSGPD